MTQPLVQDTDHIRLAMLGMNEGNGHPYSWSAIINGRYDAALMAECGYPVIPEYLGAQPPGALGIPGASVTHIWCDDPADADKVARCTYIPNVVDRPEDVIGQVDAVVIPTDIGHQHVDRARVFVEAGLPVFVDKPMTDNTPDLEQFQRWVEGGRAILSSSAMRYAHEFLALGEQMHTVGTPRLITGTMMKSWERYGIHALESVYGLLPTGGWRSVINTGTTERNVVHLTHKIGCDVLLVLTSDLKGGYGHVNVTGTEGHLHAAFGDSFHAFKSQLVAFVDFLKSGERPFPFDETVEQMRIIVAGIESREQGGARITL